MASLSLSRALPQLPRFGLLSAAIALPSISITVPPLLSDLWDSVLRAVPKKKTSHMKKRHRQMAGKALKDVQSLNKCPGCGQVKRAHLLCPNCVKAMHIGFSASGTRRYPAIMEVGPNRMNKQ